MPLRITRTVSQTPTNDAARNTTLAGTDGSTSPSPKAIALAPPAQTVHRELPATFRYTFDLSALGMSTAITALDACSGSIAGVGVGHALTMP